MKKILFSLAALLVGLFVLVKPAFAIVPNWDVTGTYVIDYVWNGGDYYNDVTLTQVGNTFTGTMSYPSGGSPTVHGIVSGTISGNDIEFTVQYDDRSYIRHDSGTIASASNISGIWNDETTSNTGTWVITSGTVAKNCTPTNFYRDGINLTARVINPTTPVTEEVDATGCNIGVYFGPGTTGAISGANIHGANYYGIVNHEAIVSINDSSIHDIGESPLNGSQHGVGVYFANVVPGPGNPPACESGELTTTGEIKNNTIEHYQKGGIVINCSGAQANIEGNIVTGEGPVSYIAQNGIQVSRGAKGQVIKNTVTGNSYSGTNNAASGGILVVGGPCYSGGYSKDVQIANNTLTGNDVGVWLSSLDNECNTATTQTNIKVINNKISNNSLNNVSGSGSPIGYQAGISEQGSGDKFITNKITGAGYDPASTNPSLIFTFWLDLIGNSLKEHANVTQ